ncbi:MAG TPA: carboxylesterase family protein [Caulobacteraceae bacterium]
MFAKLAAAFAGVSLIAVATGAAADPVHTDKGDVAGVTAGKVESFKGIPFAAPPVGDLRWRPPQPAAAWTGVKNASAFRPECMQLSRFAGASASMSEDCLTINVWRPAGTKAGDKLPVMVWIYGGAFTNGAASTPFYDGTHFAEKGVILVSANYRLGRFGFFAHPALDGGPGPVGNYGIMDQIAALKWVKANVAAFGGDTSNITVFGESAGGISVNYLMTSPAAKGLFDKAISESGFGRSVPKPLAAAEQSGASFAQTQGVTGTDAAAAAALRAIPADKVLAGTVALGGGASPGPILDGQILTQGIAQAFAAGVEAHVPYMEGGNSYEASLFEQMVSAAPAATLARAGDPAKVKAAYGARDDLDMARDVLTDTMITEPDRFLARQMDKQGVPAWVYRFDYVAEANRAKVYGAAHGSEIPFVFANLLDHPMTIGGRDIPASTDQDYKVAAAMHAYWVAFAKTGDPDSAGGVAWPRYTNAGDQLLEINADGSLAPRAGFEKDRLDLIEANVRAGGAP